jgi:hypothetical protein
MTAVEWLINQLHKKQYGDYPELSYNKMFDQAKEMEKQQIIDAWIATDNELQRMAAEQYYTSTYGSNKKIKFTEEEWAELNNGSKGSDATFPKTEPAMIVPEAISILKIHQKWRLGADIVMIEPKELTKAIDVLINYHTDIMNETLSSQTEISDDEIYKVSFEKESIDWHDGFIEGAKWYREQLKQL